MKMTGKKVEVVSAGGTFEPSSKAPGRMSNKGGSPLVSPAPKMNPKSSSRPSGGVNNMVSPQKRTK